ncbi:MAG: VOC family protein [Pseudomonadales bacterium]
MSGITELGYARFGVSNLDEWKGFARDILALEVREDTQDANSISLRMDYWHHRIVLEEDDCEELLGAGLRVAGPAEFEAMQAILTKNDISFEVGNAEIVENRKVLEVLLLKDPAGNPLEIFHGPRIDTHMPFYPGRRMHGRFVTEVGGLGHIMLAHQGLDSVYDFYKMLGMRGGIEYQYPIGPDTNLEMLFMHCSERDHSLAFGLPSDSGKNIQHMMIEVDNLDDVFVCYELVKESKYPVRLDIGRHANDGMFSFYFIGPSGWQIEVGCEGQPAKHQSSYHIGDTYGHKLRTLEDQP